MDRPRLNLQLPLVAAVLLIAAVLAVYAPLAGSDFVNYDDDGYVTANAVVREGLTARGISWAFTSTAMSNWHPLSWLSHMLDVTLFGLDPGPHHLMSVGIHVFGSLLLFALLARLTGAWLPGAAVAFLFALHPLHVESVAWVSERKDVLSTALALLALLAWLGHLRRPAISRYLAALLCFALALLAKPMPVTLPFVMLLLDVWPLSRVPRAGSRAGILARLVLEKLPFFALSFGSAAVTLAAQTGGGAVSLMEGHHQDVRLANATTAYLAYLVKALWPQGLAVYYPFPASISPLPRALAAGVCLAVLTLAAALGGRRRPYLAIGWLWYLGTLVPVIGLVRAGSASWADRYTYLPLTGVFIAVVWGCVGVAGSHPRLRRLALLAFVLAIPALAGAARLQVGQWRSSETLFRHALGATGENWQAHNNLALALENQGRLSEAAAHLREALRLSPGRDGVRVHLARVLFQLGDVRGGRELLVGVIERSPEEAGPPHVLGSLLLEAGLPGEAAAWYRRALGVNPASAEAASGLGTALALSGSPAEALEPLREALRLKPGLAHAHAGLALALANLGRRREAIDSYREALRIEPDSPETHNNLGITLEAEGRAEEAETHFRESLRLRPAYGEPLFNLAVVLAARGRLGEAQAHAQRYLALHPGDTAAAAALAGAMRGGTMGAGR